MLNISVICVIMFLFQPIFSFSHISLLQACNCVCLCNCFCHTHITFIVILFLLSIVGTMYVKQRISRCTTNSKLVRSEIEIIEVTWQQFDLTFGSPSTTNDQLRWSSSRSSCERIGEKNFETRVANDWVWIWTAQHWKSSYRDSERTQAVKQAGTEILSTEDKLVEGAISSFQFLLVQARYDPTKMV